MLLSGTGIVTPIELKINDFEPSTEYSLEWSKTSSGNWQASDRGSTYDVYDSKIKVSGHEYYINQVLSAIEANRQQTNVLTLTCFNNVDDLIFGADVDYSSGLSVTVTKLGERKQKSWHVFSLSITLRVLSPSFTGSSTLPALRYLSRNYVGDSTFTVVKKDYYDGSMVYFDENKDDGEFSGEFIFTLADMRSMRRYVATQRGATVSIPNIYGVLFPFSSRGTSTYPVSCKILSFEDKGMSGKGYCVAKIKMAQVVSET